MFFIFQELVVVKEYNVMVEEIVFAVVFTLISMMAIYTLTKIKKIYREE